MTPREIAALLAQQAEAVAKKLLPGGKREGAEWRAGSVAGDAGSSLGVHLAGTKAGVWRDFSGDKRGGDLLDLWAASRGISIAEALKEARAYLGVKEVKFEGHKPREYRRPDKPDITAPKGNVANYLLSTRNISHAALKAYQVAMTKDDTEICFPYLRGDELVNLKYLAIERVGIKKRIRLERDCEPCLFGWPAIPEDARTVALCEGELDAMSLWQYGHPALSVFSGANSHTWVEGEFPRLERFDEIFLCFDNDEAGKKGCRELAERLGRERCKVVTLPMKDANECLQRNIDKTEIDRCFAEAKTLDPVELRNAAEYVDEVIREFYPQEGDRIGFNSPWPKLHGKVRFRPGEVVLLNGVNGHGKSQCVGQIALAAMEQSEKVCVASMEMRPRLWLKRLAIQASAIKSPAPDFIRSIARWWSDKLWVFDVVGTAKVEHMLSVFRYARRRYGITVFAVDSITKCGIGDDDYSAQKAFVEALCDFANDCGITVLLVTHSRKLEAESHHADKMDIKGSGAIGDLASTIFTLWRNKPKEENPQKHADAPGAMLICQKQRHGDSEPRVWLWFDPESYQFLEGPDLRGHAYVRHLAPVRAPQTGTDEVMI